ncbi:MAG: hypothetical protein R3C32_11315 [Chloroflexota bacterium]
MATLVGCGLWLAATASAQGPSGTPHPIPTTPPGAVATRPPGIWVDPPPTPTGCTGETEPNDRLQNSPTLTGEFCVSGTLVEDRDQDLLWYVVAPEDGLVTWDVTVRGVPGAYTSIRFYALASPVGELPPQPKPGGMTPRIDSDVWIGMPPGAGQCGWPRDPICWASAGGRPATPRTSPRTGATGWRCAEAGAIAPGGDVEPNDDPASATPLSGPFALSGDLQDGRDLYRWSLTDAHTSTPWRLTARTSLGARLIAGLTDAAGATIAEAIRDTGRGGDAGGPGTGGR